MLDTLKSLTLNTEIMDRKDVLVVVQISSDQRFVEELSKKIYAQFEELLSEGFIHVIQRQWQGDETYGQLRSNFGDSIERIQWRAKQNIDVACLLRYCSGKSDFYLHLEDDVRAVPGYLTKIHQYIKEAGSIWRMLEFSPLGAIGKLFHYQDLPVISGLLDLYYDEQPLDFLIYHHLKLSVQTKRFLRIPSLFQHAGHVSSLSNQTRRLVDPFFFQLDPKSRTYENPPARLNSSMKHFHDCTLESAYINKTFGFFWGQANT